MNRKTLSMGAAVAALCCATAGAQNIEKLKTRVRLIGHENFLVLITEIGTTVVITKAA